jgi:ubiquitin carboxyl-terminal hydrolase 25
MDVAEAYSVLQLPSRDVEDQMVLWQHDSAVKDNPASAERYKQALAAIARDRNSALLLGKAGAADIGTAEEPVGLWNIGNTCYLNSLLQLLYTLVDLRRIVLDFDKYKMNLDEASLEQKRVGQRKVSMKEVQNAQRLVERLAALFVAMITTPRAAVRPEQDLARSILETEGVVERMRRRSTLKSTERPSLGTLDSTSFIGPLPNPDAQVNGITDTQAVQSPADNVPTFDAATIAESIEKNETNAEAKKDSATEDAEMNDNSSEATLVSKTGSEGDMIASTGEEANTQATATANAETNTNVDKSDWAVSPWTGQPMAPVSPSTSKPGASMGKIDPALMKYAPPPGKPPPVPPRKPVQPAFTPIEEFARQQDVTEVLSHCIFQLSCAMRALGHDKSGEQLDEIHDLFFGQITTHTHPQNDAPSTTPFLNIITRVFRQPSDIYAALDNEFDLTDNENGAKSYNSITALPPIVSIALDRVFWDNEKKSQIKLNNHVELPETIYMDRYLESSEDSDLMQRRRQTWEIKEQLAKLQARRDELEQKHVWQCVVFLCTDKC